jgi:hypothetical protein
LREGERSRIIREPVNLIALKQGKPRKTKGL